MKRWERDGALSLLRQTLLGHRLLGGRLGIRTLASLACALSGCAPAAPPSEPANESEAVHEDEPEPEPPVSREVEQEAAADETEVTPNAPPPTEVVSALCQDICSKVAQSCAERAAAFCRASCGDYTISAEECPSETHAALSCQLKADDFLLCSNIAAESCAPHYRNMQDCREGKVAARPWGQVVPSSDAEEVPDGFARLSVTDGGFSVFAPRGAQVETKAGGFFSQAELGDAKYVIESISSNNQNKLTAGHILRTATEYVGSACQPKLRLHGRYETGPVAHVRFDTVCQDGLEIRGMLHFWGENIVAASQRRAAGSASENPHLEPFLFSFRLK